MEEKMKELAVSEDPSKTQVRDVLQAKFVENVEEHMKNYENADIALKEQQDNYKLKKKKNFNHLFLRLIFIK